MSRRTSLSVIPESTLNSRANHRDSLGPTRTSSGNQNQKPFDIMETTTGATMSKPSRLSITATGTGRQSIGAARRSSLGTAPPAGQSRRASINVRGSSIALSRAEDPRDINSRAFINSNIRHLVDYLINHNYPYAISPKILTRPSTKDFNLIVQFLFKEIDPHIKMSEEKWADEVIAIFKQLRYPYPVSKTNIVAAGSPTAWPALLAAIMWLIELLAYDEAAGVGNFTSESESEDPQKAFFAYLSKTYSCFLGGDDETYALLEEQFVSSFESANQAIASEIRKIDDVNSTLERDIRQIQARTAYLPQLQAQKNDYLSDIAKFNQLLGELQAHKNDVEGKISSRKSKLKTLEVQIASTTSDIESLKERVATQELSPEDVKRMVEKHENMEEGLKAASITNESLNKKIWELETALRDKVQNLDDSAKKYNSTAEDLKLIPHTARNANGKNLAIDIDIRAKKKSGVLKTDISTDVLPFLLQLKDQLLSASVSMREDMVTIQDELDDLEMKNGQLEEEKNLLETKIKRTDEVYRREKESLETAVVAHDKEMTDMESRLIAMKDTAGEEARIAAAMRRIAELQAARDARNSAHRRMKRELCEAITEAASHCAAHRDLVTQKLGEVKDLAKSRLEALQLRKGIGSTSAMKVKASLLTSAKRIPHTQQSATVEYDQIYLEGMEEDTNQSSGGVQPSIGGMSPIGMAPPRHAAISGGSRHGSASVQMQSKQIIAAEETEMYNDCDSSAMSMALGGLADANLSLVAREQSIRNRISVKQREVRNLTENFSCVGDDGTNRSICSSII